MTTEAQKKASAKYDRNHTKSILFKFNTTRDADILAKLEEVGNKQGYIKKLIRGDICGNDEALSIDSIRLMILPVVLKYGIERATLFGSYARGEAKEDSDVDFLIECNGIDTMTEYLSLTDDLKTAIGKNVDIVMYDALQTDRSRAAKRLRQNIEKDKVIVYEKI
jgi:predicted nucleotidyltransferase